MSNYIYLFDLDSTLTNCEILPLIAEKLGIYGEMKAFTEKTISGEIPFRQSFLKRVDLLKDIPVKIVNDIVSKIELNNELISFIMEHKARCYIITGNLDVWISGLINRIGFEDHVYSSKAIIEDGYIKNVLSVVDKNAIISQIVLPFVAIGDGNNDAEMIKAAEIGIGYGGVHECAPSVLNCCSHAVYDEHTLVNFLRKTL